MRWSQYGNFYFFYFVLRIQFEERRMEGLLSDNCSSRYLRCLTDNNEEQEGETESGIYQEGN